MRLQITFNDAWESIPFEHVDEVLEFLDRILQPTHPLREYKLFPVAMCWRKDKILIEENDSCEILWVLDMKRKKQIRGKSYHYFQKLEKQEELDLMFRADYEEWVKCMKDAGAWHDD